MTRSAVLLLLTLVGLVLLLAASPSNGATVGINNDETGTLTDGKGNLMTAEVAQTGFAVELTLFLSMSAKAVAKTNAGQKMRELIAYQLNSLPGNSVTRVQEVVIVLEQEADGDTAYGGQKCMKEAKAAGGGKGNGVYFTFQVTCESENEAYTRKAYLATEGAMEHLNRAVAAYMGSNAKLCRLLRPEVRAVLAREFWWCGVEGREREV